MKYSEDKVRKDYRFIDTDIFDKLLADGFGQALDYYNFEPESNEVIYGDYYDEKTKTFSFKIAATYDKDNLEPDAFDQDVDSETFLDFTEEEHYVNEEEAAWKKTLEDGKVIEFDDGSKFCADIDNVEVVQNSIEVDGYEHTDEADDSPEWSNWDIDGELTIEISVSIKKLA